jgi:hypothetical protein
MCCSFQAAAKDIPIVQEINDEDICCTGHFCVKAIFTTSCSEAGKQLGKHVPML